MCRFIETICIEDGQILNLPRHQQRVDSTRRHFFGQMPRLNLEEHIRTTGCDNGRIRCRVTYGADIQNIEYFPYHIRSVKTLKPVECDSMEYSYKYADRTGLTFCQTRRSGRHSDSTQRTAYRHIHCQHSPLGRQTMAHPCPSAAERNTPRRTA